LKIDRREVDDLPPDAEIVDRGNQLSYVKQGVRILILYEHLVQAQPVKKNNIDTFHADRGVQLFGKPSGNLPDHPGLDPAGLKGQQERYQNDQDRPRKPKQYVECFFNNFDLAFDSKIN
jgi:hypothetical protein